MFVTAGYADSVDAPTIRETPRGDGTWIASRPLRRGDAYTRDRLHAADERGAAPRGRRVAASRADLDALPRSCSCPAAATTIGQTGAPLYRRSSSRRSATRSTRCGRGCADSTQVERRRRSRCALLRHGPYRAVVGARAAAGGRRPRRRRTSSQAVLSYLRDGFTYSETPPRGSCNARRLPVRRQERLLPAVLRRDGAAAAHGRRARARRRPASRPARWTAKTREYVVRDLDAHSWVEVWYRGIGWVTFDPTPAAAPPRSQPNEGGSSGGPAGSAGPPSLGGDRAVRPGPPRGSRAVERDAVGLDRRSPASAALALAALAFVLLAPPPPPRRHAAARDRARRARARAAPHRPASRARARRCRRSSGASPAALPPPATCARCSDAALRRRPRHADAAPSAAACAPSSPAAPARAAGCARGGRCRPARPRSARARAPTLDQSSDGRRVRPVQARHRAAGGGGVPPGHRAALQGRGARAGEDVDPRGARPGLLPLAPVRGARAWSSRPSSSARRPTTTRCSASAAR